MVPKSDPNRPEEFGGARKREERHPAYTCTRCGTKKKRGLLVPPGKGSTREMMTRPATRPLKMANVHQRIGSVTKTFTISLLLQAQADGLLSLDGTIDQYVEDVPSGDEITLGQMANMTSEVEE